MDASNPVMTSDRFTIESLLDRAGGVKRQDLSYLAEVAATTQRIQLRVEDKVPLSEVKAIVSQFKEQIPKISTEKTGMLKSSVFEKKFESIPICGILDEEGVPLHPPSVNNRQGRLSVTRVMGGSPGAPMGLADLVEVLGDDVLKVKHVYTAGTWLGFCNRLEQQMGRKTVPIRQTIAVLGKKATMQRSIKVLDRLMPRKPNPQWPCIVGDFYEGLTTSLKVTANSSAGAPYWRNKGLCMPQIMETGLPVLLQALKDNKLDELWRENPEMFICEVKNKMDRYKITELTEKTRPYVCVPAHWAFLFSVLTQGFQETLEVFTENPTSSNAYGFSSSKGGLKKMVQWMNTADRRGKVVCYGDDACIVVRRGKHVYRIDPDFKQMDGSLDRDDIALTVEWILSHVARDVGKVPHVWRAVAQQWVEMASNPYFVVDGTVVYKKKTGNGLMTGVPGTTLFDTVKSVLAWNKLLDVCDEGAGDILDEKFVTQWMAKNGLVVKSGTWVPAIVPEVVNPGELVTDHKFLGVQIMCVNWRNTIQFVPTIPYEDAVEMLVVQKDNPFERVASRTSRARTLYDRMRGLQITMGFTHPRITQAIHNVVNHLPPEVVLMQVQNGTGERPEHVTLQDFSYPDSSGFPSYDFCVSVYADEGEGEWIQLFPDLTERLDMMKQERKRLSRTYRMLLQEREGPGPLSLEVRAVEEEPKPLHPEYEVVEASQPIQLPVSEKVNPRSKIFVENSGVKQLRKVSPTLGQAVKLHLTHIGGISQVNTICQKFAIRPEQLRKEAHEWGFYITGVDGWEFVSLYPMVTPFPSEQEEILDSLQKKRDVINRASSERAQGLKASDRLVETAPEMVLLNLEILGNLHADVKTVASDREALEMINVLLAKNGLNMKWASEVEPTRANSVAAHLAVRSSGNGNPELWTVVATAWSLSKRLAQGYIAKAILETNFVAVESSRFSTMFVPPPKEVDDWAEEVEQEIEYLTPIREPLVRPLVLDDTQVPPFPRSRVINMDYRNFDESRLLRIVSEKVPHVPEKFLSYAFSLVSSGKVSNEQELLLRMVDMLEKDYSSREEGTPSSPVSKRSRLTQERRKKLNRKTLEKRKARYKPSATPKV